MKSVHKKIKDQVLDHVIVYDYEQAQHQISEQVRNQVENQVWIRVENQVWDQIYSRVSHEISS